MFPEFQMQCNMGFLEQNTGLLKSVGLFLPYSYNILLRSNNLFSYPLFYCVVVCGLIVHLDHFWEASWQPWIVSVALQPHIQERTFKTLEWLQWIEMSLNNGKQSQPCFLCVSKHHCLSLAHVLDLESIGYHSVKMIAETDWPESKKRIRIYSSLDLWASPVRSQLPANRVLLPFSYILSSNHPHAPDLYLLSWLQILFILTISPCFALPSSLIIVWI